MAYYLVKIEVPGATAYKDEADAKRVIDAFDLADAKDRANEIAEDHPQWGDAAKVRLFNEVGLVATRCGKGTWDA